MANLSREFVKPSVSDVFGKPKRIIALVSDMHVLSDFALCPDDLKNYETGEDVSAMRNSGQLVLLGFWKEFLGICDKWNVDTVVNLGDTCAGLNPKESGRNIMDSDIEVQLDAAVALLEPLVKNRVFHQVSGTKYHEIMDARIHKTITDRLRPSCKEAIFHHMIANIRLRGTKRMMNIAHAATSSQIYRTMILDREALFMLVAEAQGKLPHIDYIVRGHLHYYSHIDIADQHLIQVPGWMCWFPYKDAVRLYGRMQPDIGGVVLFIDEKDRTTVHHYLYPAPKIIDFVKDG